MGLLLFILIFITDVGPSLTKDTEGCVGSDVMLDYGNFPKTFTSVKWLRDAINGTQTEIAEIGKFFKIFEPYKGRLLLSGKGDIKMKDVNINDDGFYIRTVIGETSVNETIYLRVLDPPNGKPKFDFQEKEENLTCKLPDYKGNPEVFVSIFSVSERINCDMFTPYAGDDDIQKQQKWTNYTKYINITDCTIPDFGLVMNPNVQVTSSSVVKVVLWSFKQLFQDSDGVKHNSTLAVKGGNYECCMDGKALTCVSEKSLLCTSIRIKNFDIEDIQDEKIIPSIIGGLVGLIVFIILLTIYGFYRRLKRKKTHDNPIYEEKIEQGITELEPLKPPSKEEKIEQGITELEPLKPRSKGETDESKDGNIHQEHTVEQEYIFMEVVVDIENESKFEYFQPTQSEEKMKVHQDIGTQYDSSLEEDFEDICESKYKSLDAAATFQDLRGLFSMCSNSVDSDQERNRLIEITSHIIRRFLDQFNMIRVRAYEVVLTKLLQDGFAVITGISGSGKTTLAYQLMNSLKYGNMKCKRKQPIIISDKLDWKRNLRRSENLVIFINNMFNESSATSFIEWQNILMDIENICTGAKDPNRNFVIIEIQAHAFENRLPCSLKDHTIFQSICKMEDEKNFSLDDKLQFLNQCRIAPKCSLEDKVRILRRTKLIGLPLCCNLFMRLRDLQNRGVEILYEPLVCLRMQLRHLWDDDKVKFGVLALVMLNGGHIHQDSFRSHHNIKKLNNVCQLNIKGDFSQELLQSALSFEGNYLDYDKITAKFSFPHYSIFHAVAMTLWNEDCEKVIQYCSLDFLTNVQSETIPNRHVYTVVVTDRYFPSLAKRIAGEIRYGQSKVNRTVSNMNIWDDALWCRVFNNVVIKHYTDLNKEDNNSYSLLYHAITARNMSLVKFLYNQSPRVRQCYDACNVSCLMGDLEFFSVCRNNFKEYEPEWLFSAVKGGNEAILKLLKPALDFVKKFKSNVIDKKTTTLQEICLCKDIGFFKHSTLNLNNEKFLSIATEQQLIFYAVAAGSVELVGYLIRRGLDVFQKIKVHGTTCLHYGCGLGNLEVVKYLSTFPGLLSTPDNYGLMPVHYAAIGTGNIEVATYLIKESINIDSVDNMGATVFHYACSGGNLTFVSFLFEQYRSFVDAKDKNNRSALHYVALGTGSSAVAVFLIDQGINPQTKDCFGNTALEFAEARNLDELVQILIDYSNQWSRLSSSSNLETENSAN